MSLLPSGWVEVFLSDVVQPYDSIDPTKTPTKQYQYIDIGSIDNNSQTIVNPKIFAGIDAPSRARRIVKSGDTLFSTVRTYLKNIAIVPECLSGNLTSTGVTVLRPSQVIEPRYLFKWVCSDPFVSRLSEAQDGTMYPAVSDKDVTAGKILVPPLPEQRRIVAKIDGLSAKSGRARAHLDHIPRLVEKYKQAVLAAAFRGDLTREWRHCMGVGGLWTKRSVAEIATISSGQTPKGIEEALEHFGEIHWFKVSSMNEEVNRGGLCESKFRISKENARKIGLRKFSVGSIVFPKRGGAIATNKKRRLLVDGALDLNIMALTPTAVSSDYLWWWMQGVDLSSISNGSNVPQINNGDIAPLIVPVPSPEEQGEVVRLVGGAMTWIDRLASEASSALKLVDRLDQAVLAKAFRGELVPQDPTDEPASVLLERIRAERGDMPKTGRRGRPRKAP